MLAPLAPDGFQRLQRNRMVTKIQEGKVSDPRATCFGPKAVGEDGRVLGRDHTIYNVGGTLASHVIARELGEPVQLQ